MYSAGSERSRGSSYAHFTAINNLGNSSQSIETYISICSNSHYDRISEIYHDRPGVDFRTQIPERSRPETPPRNRNGSLHVGQLNSQDEDQSKTNKFKRPCLFGIVLVVAVVISSAVTTFAVLYIKEQENNDITTTYSPISETTSGVSEDILNPNLLNRSNLRRINGSEVFADCIELKLYGNDIDGVYTIYPYPLSDTPVKVYCDMTTKAGGWTVFQHRRDGSVDFWRLWDKYKAGFGNVSGEYWLGNDHLHQLTSLGVSDLYVRLENFTGYLTYARYSNFSVADESDGYRLRLKAGSYEGNAGDAMDSHESTNPNGLKFSTPDRDNDNAPAQCSHARRGAWWYNQCTLTNLNGIYGNGGCVEAQTCNFWYLLNKSYVGVKTSSIMVRRV